MSMAAQRETDVGQSFKFEAADSRSRLRSQFGEERFLGFVVGGLVLTDVDADAQFAARQVAFVCLEILPPEPSFTLSLQPLDCFL